MGAAAGWDGAAGSGPAVEEVAAGGGARAWLAERVSGVEGAGGGKRSWTSKEHELKKKRR